MNKISYPNLMSQYKKSFRYQRVYGGKPGFLYSNVKDEARVQLYT